MKRTSAKGSECEAAICDRLEPRWMTTRQVVGVMPEFKSAMVRDVLIRLAAERKIEMRQISKIEFRRKA